jgi:hypothetical protein
MVKNVWERPVTATSPIQRWNMKLHALRSHLSGWARHVTCVLRKEKLRLSSIIDDLEALAETIPLSLQQIELKNQSNVRKKSNGTNALRANSSYKETRILDTSIMLLMGDIG